VGKIEARRLVPYEGQLRKLAAALDVPSDDCASLIAGADSADVRGRHG
jgi:hypothetical protein